MTNSKETGAIFFPKPLSAERVAETMFSMASHATKRVPLYGAFDGDVLMHWSTGRRACEQWAAVRGLKFQRIA